MDYFKIGQIVNTQGIKGEVKIYPYTDDLEKLAKIKKIYLDEELKSCLNVEKSRVQKTFLIAKFKEIDSIDDALKYKNKYVYIKRNSDEKLDEDTYYVEDLIGFEVYEQDNRYIGNLKYIFNTGANDIYEIENMEKKTIYLPAIKDVILDIDLKSRKIVVKLMEGLI